MSNAASAHGVTLKKVQHAEFASEETSCFRADVYIDGKLAGSVSNEGHGGPNMYTPWSLEQRLNTIAGTLPDYMDDKILIEGKPMVLKMDADLLIGDLFDGWQVERQTRKLVSQMKDRIFMLCEDGALKNTKKLPPERMEALLARGHDGLRKIWPDAKEILNLMPPDRAAETFRAAV